MPANTQGHGFRDLIEAGLVTYHSLNEFALAFAPAGMVTGQGAQLLARRAFAQIGIVDRGWLDNWPVGFAVLRRCLYYLRGVGTVR